MTQTTTAPAPDLNERLTFLQAALEANAAESDKVKAEYDELIGRMLTDPAGVGRQLTANRAKHDELAAQSYALSDAIERANEAISSARAKGRQQEIARHAERMSMAMFVRAALGKQLDEKWRDFLAAVAEWNANTREAYTAFGEVIEDRYVADSLGDYHRGDDRALLGPRVSGRSANTDALVVGMCRMLVSTLGGEYAARVVDIDDFHGLHAEGVGWEGAARVDFDCVRPWIMKTIEPKAGAR